MKKLEKIIALGVIVIGGSLLGIGFYRDKKFPHEYTKNGLIKSAGLISLAAVSGLGLRELIEGEDRRYFEEHNKNYPRQNNSQKGL